MSDPGSFVSKNDPPLLRGGVNPRRLHLHEFDRWGAGNFQLHEIGYLPLGLRWHYDRLCNPFWRFYYNSKPGSYIEMGGERHRLEPDQVMVIPDNTLFNSRGAPGVPHLWIHFSPPLTARFVAERFTLPLSAALAATIGELQEQCLGPRQTRVERQRIFHAGLAVIHACFSRSPLGQESPFPPALGLILEGIERSLGQPQPNGELAQRAGMSVEGFGRWFRRHLGITPARYVTRRRVREACRLLALTDLSIEAVAENVGFANRHHFSRVFHENAGRSPAQFRREHAERVS
ncbi:Helix-turn-helix domain-containing protein [Verrucomicrobium sp. GAS474]|uniref:AraC family transcriptional regulator n=1 Tax=Verrucomicrobium sp. GAS474 TaxID=1882831 RepID=UPI00087D8886|nr:helix-turn-helix domain-containing protein [Verrucomicrobium sp. GAS474]SDU30787.1 Helix-turn-helix domain-containing protein [Verrucomicrobium sp. GAS474]